MSAISTIEASGDILKFLPACCGEELELRSKLRAQRNAMSAMIASTESDTARALAWLVVEYVSRELYAPAPIERLLELRRFCHRLSLTAMQAEDIDQ